MWFKTFPQENSRLNGIITEFYQTSIQIPPENKRKEHFPAHSETNITLISKSKSSEENKTRASMNIDIKILNKILNQIY